MSDDSMEALVKNGDVRGLARRAGYRKRFGTWRPARGGPVGDRLAAIECLATIGSRLTQASKEQAAAVVEVLLAALESDPDESVRVACALGLAVSPTDRAADALAAALADESPAVRVAAALGAMAAGGSKSPTPRAQQALQGVMESDPGVYLNAIAGLLHKIGDTKGPTIRLQSCLDHAVASAAGPRFSALRASLADLLAGSIGTEARRAGRERRRFKDAWLAACRRLIGAYEESDQPAPVGFLFAALAASDRGYNRAVTSHLERLGPDAVEPTVRLACDIAADDDLRGAALRFLAGHPDARVVEPLLELIESAAPGSWEVPLVAAALGATGDRRIVGPLGRRMLTEPTMSHRIGRIVAPLVGDDVPHLVRLGIWAACDRGPEIASWIESAHAGGRSEEVAEAEGFLLARLPAEPEAAVETVAALLAVGAEPDHPSIERLAAGLRAMAATPDEELTSLQVGDQDVYTATEIESREDVRERGRRLLARLSLEG
jgi:HEAT repeat protein